jgi:hypothetical protein
MCPASATIRWAPAHSPYILLLERCLNLSPWRCTRVTPGLTVDCKWTEGIIDCSDNRRSPPGPDRWPTNSGLSDRDATPVLHHCPPAVRIWDLHDCMSASSVWYCASLVLICDLHCMAPISRSVDLPCRGLVVLRFPAHKSAPVQHVTLDQDRNRIVTASQENLKIWDLSHLTCLRTHRLPFRVRPTHWGWSVILSTV